MSGFRPRFARGSSGAGRHAEPPLLVDTDERAARAVRAINETFSSTSSSDEAKAWARLEPRLDRRRRARFWLRGAGVLAVASALGTIAFALWRGTPLRRSEPLPSVPATEVAARSPGPAVEEAPNERTPPSEKPPSEPPEAAPLAEGPSIISTGVRARLSRGGRARYFPGAEAHGYLVLEKGTLELESPASAHPNSPAAERPLEVRVAGWEVRGGGRFEVAAHGRRVEVSVERGEVSVSSSVRVVARVFAGERWSSSPTEETARLPEPSSTTPSASRPDEPRDCLRLVRDGVTAAAIACLESQSAEPGLSGEIALLELARIRRDVKGDLAGAERLLAEHERRFPQSGLAAEARGARIELLLRLEKPAEALAEAQRLGGSEASYWRAVSLAALGRRDEARDALDDYLRRPDVQRRSEAMRARHELGP